MTGASILLFLLLVNLITATIVSGTSTSSEFVRCTGTDTNATCENVGKTTFFHAVADVALGNFGTGTPLWISAVWVLVGGLLLSVAILLIVLAFIPLTNE